MSKQERYVEARSKVFHAEADLRIELCAMGDRLAKKFKWASLGGIEAIERYLIDKYHWLPRDVKCLTTDDLWMLMDGVKEARSQPKRRRTKLSDLTTKGR